MFPDWIFILFIFVFGASVGSFLNVVIYRLPRDKSLIYPGSACPACNTSIRFYDNIPILSWLILGARCRNCKTKISLRYFIIELLTACLFVALYVVYFMTPLRCGLHSFFVDGWFLYLIHIIMLASLVAASAIDLELWVIPLSICWVITITGFLGAAFGPLIFGQINIRSFDLFPTASAKVAASSAGALIGWIISLFFLKLGIFKTSYLNDQSHPCEDDSAAQQKFNHRLEMLKEVIFLFPIIICSFLFLKIYMRCSAFSGWWIDFSQLPVIAGLLGSLWGYFIGCGIVWGTRILGTFLFGREAMGLGDVHLMGAAGAVVGPWPVVVAFFIAPFFGLSWAVFQMFFKKIKQIPYGPFLSMGLFVVMILHDGIRNWLRFVLFR